MKIVIYSKKIWVESQGLAIESGWWKAKCLAQSLEDGKHSLHVPNNPTDNGDRCVLLRFGALAVDSDYLVLNPGSVIYPLCDCRQVSYIIRKMGTILIPNLEGGWED